MSAHIREGCAPFPVIGVQQTQKAHCIAALMRPQADRGALVLTGSESEARTLAEDLSAFLPGRVLHFPARMIQLRAMAAHSVELSARRIYVLSQLTQKSMMEIMRLNPEPREQEYREQSQDKSRLGNGGLPPLVVCSVESLLIRLAPPEAFIENTKTIQTGMRVDMTRLITDLAHAGYQRVDQVEGRGQIAVRGALVDVFPLSMDVPVRIEFFDDEIDTLRVFDVQTQRSENTIQTLHIPPALETPVTPEATRRCIRLFEQAAQDGQTALEAQIPQRLDILRQGVPFEGAENYVPCFYEHPYTLLDYLGSAPYIFISEPEQIREQAGRLKEDYITQATHFLEHHETLNQQIGMQMDYTDLFPELLSEWTVFFEMLPHSIHGVRMEHAVTVAARGAANYQGDLNMLAQDMLRAKRKHYRTLLCCGDAHRARKLEQWLMNEDVEVVYAPDLKRAVLPGEVVLLPRALHHGFEYVEERILVLTEREIYGERKRRARQARRPSTALDLFTDLHAGDYIVHERHGIGVYKGIVQIKIEGLARDYIVIQYQGADKLYVPAEQMNCVQKYVGMDDKSPRISKLGGSDWGRVKQRVRESIKELAFDLIELYAKRNARKGFAFSADNEFQSQFEQRFPFEETPDQLACIEEIKKDMQSPHIMDRLLCGDVGYGKTEVALRAAFKAVSDSKQVAFLVPTTVLAQQHYHTILSRFEGFPVRVEVLSRFKTAAQQRGVIKGLKNGAIDIVVGTHRLLGQDVAFKNLGLLVVDEEQRFGVGHKERIKTLRENVDVLTLSATPIPRTLHMSLLGIRDMSTIYTPPEERQVVQTMVLEYSDTLVREAIQREMSRGGQVYFVYNHVRNMQSFAAYLRDLCPDARIAIAHGQMGESSLEKVMLQFYEGLYDVLLCSTIIESGLDIPNVNTIIVYDSDRFGLSQLYQLRGRVGRSSRAAFAYLTFRRDKVLTESAEKRLNAIREFTEFGAGFKIAMRDLEIRGAGNIIGPEQHGHMTEVGYDMYTRLMEQAVREARGEAVQEERACTLNIGVEAYIPDTYIKDELQKIEMYKRIAQVLSEEERKDVIDELIDRFGELPPSVLRLIDIAVLKNEAQRLEISAIEQRGGDFKIKLFPDAGLDTQALMQVLQEYAGGVKLSATEQPIIRLHVPRNSAQDPVDYLRGFVHRMCRL